jgi:hypothetical protein
MKKFFTLSLTLIFFVIIQNANSQNGNFQMDNGVVRGVYSAQVNYEESVILKPTTPGNAVKAYIYLSGSTPAKDTIWMVGDPGDGALPPSLWCRYINSYMGVIVDYKGTAGWYELDLTSYKNINFKGIPVGGLNALVIQHTIKPGGPYFTIDSQTQTLENANSFLNDVYKPNPNFYNIAGTIYSITQGRYMVRLQMEYNFLDEDNKPVVTPPRPTFVDETTKSGLLNSSAAPIAFEMASVVDMNNDGYDDVSIGSNYFINKKNGTFENISSKINISNGGSVWADVDNDGFKDFYSVRGGTGDRIYYGKADGTYEESTSNTFAIDAPTVTPIFFDYNSDGLLDLFIAYGRRESGGVETYFPDKLYKNTGNRTFKDVTVESGISKGEPAPFYDTWGASVYDYNSDGLPDIFVATYRLAPDLLYKNNGDGTFTEVGTATGVRGAATYYDNYFGHGMGSDWGNLYGTSSSVGLVVGNLGHPDSRALASNPSLAWSKLDNESKFTDVTSPTDLRFYEMNAGVLLADFNNDQLNDLVHAQYAYYKKGDGKDKFTRFYISKKAEGNSVSIFEDKTWELGPRIHGAWSPVRGDFDNDGGIDVIVASSNQYAALYSNKLQRGNWISFKISGDGTKVNRDGFGTRINLYSNNKIISSGYLPGTILNARAAQSSSDLHFGLGSLDKIDSIVAKFQDGKTVNYGSLKINTKHWIKYDGTKTMLPSRKPIVISPINEKIYRPGEGIRMRARFLSDEVFCYFKILDSTYKLISNSSVSYDPDQVITDTVSFEVFRTFNESKYYAIASAMYKDSSVVVSDTCTFYIDYGKDTNKISLLSPTNGESNVKLGTDLKWEKLFYLAIHIQISKNPDFNEPVFNKKIQNTSMITYYNPVEFVKDYNTKYYWRVRGAESMDVNGDGEWGPWSDVFNFTTELGTSVEDDNPNLAKFGFIEIYPNPAQNLTTFEFELPYFANLSFALFDLYGKKVADITEGYFEPGIHKINYDVSNISSGTYLLRISDGAKIISNKINIVK